MKRLVRASQTAVAELRIELSLDFETAFSQLAASQRKSEILDMPFDKNWTRQQYQEMLIEYKDAVLAFKSLYEDVLNWIEANYKRLHLSGSRSSISECIYFTNLADKHGKHPRVVELGLSTHKIPKEAKKAAGIEQEKGLDAVIAKLKELGFDTSVRSENIGPHTRFLINSKQKYKTYREAIDAFKKWVIENAK